MAPPHDSYPPEVDPDHYGLGALTAVFRVRAVYLVRLTLIGLIACGLACLLYWTGVWGWVRLLGVLVIVAILAVLIILNAIINRRLRVLAFADGLAYIRTREPIVCHWNEIDAVWCRESVETEPKVTRWNWCLHTGHTLSNLVVGSSHVYTIRLRDGRQLTFTDHLNQVEQLGATIVQETGHRLLPQALATFDAGGITEFGQIHVIPTGVRKGTSMLPWDQIEEAYMEKGFVVVKKRGESRWHWLRETAARVPNVHVLIPLVNEIVARHTP